MMIGRSIKHSTPKNKHKFINKTNSIRKTLVDLDKSTGGVMHWIGAALVAIYGTELLKKMFDRYNPGSTEYIKQENIKNIKQYKESIDYIIKSNSCSQLDQLNRDIADIYNLIKNDKLIDNKKYMRYYRCNNNKYEMMLKDDAEYKTVSNNFNKRVNYDEDKLPRFNWFGKRKSLKRKSLKRKSLKRKSLKRK